MTPHREPITNRYHDPKVLENWLSTLSGHPRDSSPTDEQTRDWLESELELCDPDRNSVLVGSDPFYQWKLPR